MNTVHIYIKKKNNNTDIDMTKLLLAAKMCKEITLTPILFTQIDHI